MSPRISTKEAATIDLPLNPFKRRRIVLGHLFDIAQETGLEVTVDGLIGRSQLIEASQAADEIEHAKHVGGTALQEVIEKYGLDQE